MSENEEIKALEKQLADLAEKLSEFQFDKQTAAINKNVKEVEELTEKIKLNKTNQEQLNKQLIAAKKAQEEHTKSIEDSKKAFKSFGEALANTSNDLSKFAPSVTTAVSSTIKGVAMGGASLASSMGLVTKVTPLFAASVKFAADAAGIFAGSLIKYTETIVKAYDATASIGAAAGITSIELERLGRGSRFSGDDLKVFGDIVKKQGSTLVALGGGVAGGVEAFADFVNVGEDQLKKYRMLGISQTQLAEYQGQYASSLIRSGISIDNSADGIKKLKQSSLEYRDILYSLSTMTGDTLEEQQKAQAFAESQTNFQARQAQLNMEVIRLQEEEKNALPGVYKDELNARIAATNAQIENNRVFSQLFDPSKVGLERATGYLDSIASAGEGVSDAMIKLKMTGVDANEFGRSVANFTGTEEERMLFVAQKMKDEATAVDEFVQRYGRLATDFGDVSRSTLQEVGGIGTEAMTYSARIRQNSAEELAKQTAKKFGEDPILSLQSESEELARNFRDISSVLKMMLLPQLGSGLGKMFETVNAAADVVMGRERNKDIEGGTGNEVSGTGVVSTAIAGIAGFMLARGAIQKGRSLFGRSTPTLGSTSPAVTPTDPSDRRTIRERTTPTGRTIRTVESTGGGTSTARPSPPVRQPSKFTRLVQKVGEKYGPRAAGKLAVSAGLLAVPGPGWIMALINLGFNASLAWGIYQIWKEISGGAEDTSEDTITENATPIAGMSAATNELTQSLAQLTGTDTESGTIPTLTNSFDDLISTTDMLIEAFGSLKTSINSNNIATASTTSRPSGTGSANTQTASTTSRPSDTGTINVASMQPALSRYMPGYAGTNVSEQETKDFIIGNEGIRYEPYEDTLGNWTVGVGHLIGKDLPSNMNRRFSHQEIMDLFDNDFIHHKTAAERIPGFDKMDGLGQTALTDLTFNMGPSWINSWPNLANQLGEGDIPSAADNLRNSRWYDQVGNRGPRVTNMLEDSTMISAAQGGIASGPETGYLGKLHGTELIQPINSDSVLSKLATTPESSSDANINSNEIQTRMSEMYRSNMMLVETLNSKLDSMISKLEDSNYIQERILSNTV